MNGGVTGALVNGGAADPRASGAADPRAAHIPAAAWDSLVEWLPENGDPDRPPLTLSTVSPTGVPDARTVLLSEFDASGFYFHTDASSRKVADIEAHPAVALTFLWPGATRQLVVQGRAELAPQSEIAWAYRARSPYLQQLAWQNTREFAQLPAEDRRRQWAAFLAEHPGGFEQPGTWTGFLVRPVRLTFWRSDPDAPSHRIEYALDGDAWVERHLAG